MSLAPLAFAGPRPTNLSHPQRAYPARPARSTHAWGTATLLLAAVLLQACGGSDDDSPTVLASDDFTHGTAKWKVEQQDPTGTVVAQGGVLDIVQPSGATIWFQQRLSGNHEIRFTATPIPVTFPGTPYVDRISDLNVFWNATGPGTTGGDPTATAFDGALASYNPLLLYYVGFGANGNTTTRLRRYDGTATRPQITGYATPASATVDDKAGDMTTATSLKANTPVAVRIVSRQPTAADPANLKWYADGQLIFSHADPAPYLSGWFALRTTVSHLQIRDFSVVALPSD